MAANRYPLSWPTGWKRTKERVRGRFKNYVNQVSVAEGADRVLDALRLMGVPEVNVIISTNIEPTLTGRPRSSQAEPLDPGVAVYWQKLKQHRVMAIDRYTRVADNLAAIAATLEAMRAIERHGGAEILDRAFTGFTALPEPKDWRSTLGVGPEERVSLEIVKSKFRSLAMACHPDNGGSHERMAELNRAWEQAQTDLVA